VKITPSLLVNQDSDNRGINMVDLMMWLVIAALLLAAALQGIGYYQKASNVYLMKDEVNGVVANVHAASSIEGSPISDDLLDKVIGDHNAAHNNDGIVISYGYVTANAAGDAKHDYGFDLASATTSTSVSSVYYLKAASESVDDSYVLYFFSETRTFPQGISTVPKARIDGGDFGEIATPGETTQPTETSSPSPSAEPTVSSTPEPSATPTPTPPPGAASVPTETSTPTPTPPPVVKTNIDLKYDAVNGPALLGAPKDVEKDMATGGGRYRDYTTGSIVWSSTYGAFTSMNGPIRDKWLATGAENRMGYPTSDDNQPIGTGKQQKYANGAIVSSSAGTYISAGGIRTRWLAGGAETGRMKFPTSDEVGGLKNGGFKQSYQGGAIYWSPQTGGYEMGGAFLPTWIAHGGENVIGYPISNEYWVGSTGTRQDFQNGHYLFWNASTGAVTMY
jgi:uncharacterized protein with LGFP repeats